MTVALSAVMSSVPSADWVALAPVAIPVVAMLLVLVLEVPLGSAPDTTPVCTQLRDNVARM